MSENNIENNIERKLEGGETERPEAASVERAQSPQTGVDVPQIPEDRETAPRAEAGEGEKKAPAPKKGKKKRKKSGVALPVMAVLLVAALVFGLAAGYGIGRSTLLNRAEQAEAQLAELTAALEEGTADAGYNVFDEEITAQNQQALNELSGTSFEDDGDASALVGEDDLAGGTTETTAEAVTVAEYDGGELMSDEVAQAYDERMASYLFSGYSEDEAAESTLNEVMREMIQERLLENYAKENGLYELSAEDSAAIDAEATARYDEQLAFYQGDVDTSGMTDEEAQEAVKAYLSENEGVTYESLRAEIESGWWKQKVYDALTADVTVDDAALESAYQTLLSEQKESFEAYPDDYEFAQMNGEIIVYNLSGYRAVKLLMIGLDDAAAEAVAELNEEIAGLDSEADAERIAECQAQIDSYYADAENRMQGVLEELENGADFDDLIDQYGTDEGMRDAALRATGYYVAQDSLLWSQELISAAMALQTAGDVSDPLRTSEGVCVVEYLGEVSAGEVPLDDVRERLQAETLETAKQEAYEAELDAWLEEANVKYYPERMQ